MPNLLARDDLEFVVAFAGCSLDEKPGSNWVQKAGSLPEYICEVARAVKRSGKSTSQAIAIAVSRVKKWSTGAGVDKDTQAKAAKAVAEWEKLKTTSKLKSKARKSSRTLAASHADDNFICLANTKAEYNVDDVRAAFNLRTREARQAWRKANPTANYDDPDCPPHMWVKELWNTFLIVQTEYGDNPELYKVPYTVDANNNVTFGDPTEVKSQYVEVDDENELTDDALKQLMNLTGPCPRFAADKFLSLTPRSTALERVLRLSAD